jgi:hypothetical protein
MYSGLGFCDQELLAMRTRHLGEPLAHFLDQLRIALPRPLIFAGRFDVTHLTTETVFAIVCHNSPPH